MEGFKFFPLPQFHSQFRCVKLYAGAPRLDFAEGKICAGPFRQLTAIPPLQWIRLYPDASVGVPTSSILLRKRRESFASFPFGKFARSMIMYTI